MKYQPLIHIGISMAFMFIAMSVETYRLTYTIWNIEVDSARAVVTCLGIAMIFAVVAFVTSWRVK